MVAYSFKKRFAPKIAARIKKQTIRAERTGRSRHARPGELMQLYVGMRTKHCTKIMSDPICKRVERIEIDVPDTELKPCFYRMPDRPEQPQLMIDNLFAIADGFNTAAEMVAFWIEEHGPGLFKGVVIYWDDNGENHEEEKPKARRGSRGGKRVNRKKAALETA